MTPRQKFFFTSAGKRLARTGLKCPACGSSSGKVVARKFIVLTLSRCPQCHLLFRAPSTTEAENEAYYQEEYQLGFTTEMPTPERLAQLKRGHFHGSGKDFSDRIELMKNFGAAPGQKLLDFGCSWGYGAWQFLQAGFSVQGFELSQSRCAYAVEQLGIPATSQIEALGDKFDVVFSAHVLEHVPNPEQSVRFLLSKLRPGGLFFAFTPNGSLERRAADPSGWQQAWGMNHPNLLDEEFYHAVLSGTDYVLASEPYGSVSPRQLAATPTCDALLGGELLAIARKR